MLIKCDFDWFFSFDVLILLVVDLGMYCCMFYVVLWLSDCDIENVLWFF